MTGKGYKEDSLSAGNILYLVLGSQSINSVGKNSVSLITKRHAHYYMYAILQINFFKKLSKKSQKIKLGIIYFHFRN